VSEIVDLLREGVPGDIGRFEPQRTENVNYSRVCRGCNYELHYADVSLESTIGYDHIWVDDVLVEDSNIDCRNIKIRE